MARRGRRELAPRVAQAYSREMRLVPLAILFLAATAAAQASLRLPNVFGNGMVLQRGKDVRIWGWSKPSAKVVVRFAGQTRHAIADAEGRFEVVLQQLVASATGRELVVESGERKRTIRDVLVGEVWLCGGQSNMEWTLRGSRDGDIEIPSARYEKIRFLRLPKVARAEPQTDFPVKGPNDAVGNWRTCTSNHVETCTAVGYYFARRLHRMLGVPVGLIDSSWGGTMAQHWVPSAQLRDVAAMKPFFAKYESRLREYVDGGGTEGAERRYAMDLASWEKRRTQARAEGKRAPRRPRKDAYASPAHKAHPGAMFNGVIAPVRRFTVRGVVFYQGENNSFGESWKPFPRTFPAVIREWRAALGDPELPFGIVQIAGWSNRRSMTYDMNHHCNIVREVQFRTWKQTDKTGLIVTFDTNSNGSIHPGRKQPVGERCARWALAEVYESKPYRGRSIEWLGPVYESMEIRDNKILIRFEEATCRGLRLDQDVDVGFYIAGSNREFRHARARVVKGDRLEVWSDEIKAPIAVRYGWSNLPAGGLMNGRELPAFPFRTDDWPLVPHQSKGAYEVGKR